MMVEWVERVYPLMSADQCALEQINSVWDCRRAGEGKTRVRSYRVRIRSGRWWINRVGSCNILSLFEA